MSYHPCVDLRSDTVTRPSPSMREAIAQAEVGDDVYGEDPTVAALELYGARMLGKEASVLMPSGTQSNLCALMTHCERGDEYIAATNAHIFRNEGGGGAILGGVQAEPVAVGPDGGPCLEAVEQAIKPDDPHYPRSRLLCLENTVAGRPLSLDYIQSAAGLAGEYGLRLHLDGARLFNAALALETHAAHLCAAFDSVSVCLSKGLGAPAGTLLASSSDRIPKLRRWRKMLGGGLRQAGIIAAGGLFALEHNIERLREDHRRAAMLAAELSTLPAFRDAPPSHATNMVFLHQPKGWIAALADHLRPRGILIGRHGRLVCHLDVDDAGIDRTIAAVRCFNS